MAHVVLLHGLAGSSRWWSGNIAALAQGHDVHVLDLPGFGAQRRQRSPLADAPAYVCAWLRERGLGGVHLVGHSLGGAVAARVAARHPDLVERLVLVAPAGTLAHRPLHRHALELALAAVSPGPRFLPRLGADALRAGPGTILRASRELLGDDSLRAELRAIGAPTLLVWGDRDPLVPRSVADVFLNGIRDASLVVIQGAGHVPMVERPKEFNRVLREFLEG